MSRHAELRKVLDSLGIRPRTEGPCLVSLFERAVACDLAAQQIRDLEACVQAAPAPSLAPPWRTAADYPGYKENFQAEAAALFNAGLAAGINWRDAQPHPVVAFT